MRLVELFFQPQPFLRPLGHDPVRPYHDQAEDDEEDGKDGKGQDDHPALELNDGPEIVGKILDHLDYPHDLAGMFSQSVFLSEWDIGLQGAEDLSRTGEEAEQGTAGNQRRIVFPFDRLLIFQSPHVALPHQLGNG